MARKLTASLPFRFLPVLLPVLLLVLALFPAPGLAAPDVDARMSYARAEDGSVVAGLTLSIPRGYHAYSHDPGDAGRPCELFFDLDGAGPSAVYYPEGSLQRDYYDREAQVSVYEGTRLIYTVLPEDAAGKPWKATLSLLLCSELNCTPVDRKLSGTVPRNVPGLDAAEWKDDWLALSTGTQPVTPGVPGMVFSMDAGGATAMVPAGGMTLSPPDGNDGPLPAPAGFDFELTPVYADNSVEIYGLGKALLFGILAGLLLNVMPCVLPVLSFKMVGFLMMHGQTPESLRTFRQHNLYFSAGIITLFTILAFVLGLMDMMWGQLYQSQEFLLILLMMIFLMGLSMMGVFTLPMIDLRALSRESGSPRLQAYLTGLLSTFLATPCSGPLLGGVLGWAFTQPLPILVVVFWSVGLGMTLPYIVLSIWPRLALALPRPGPWMQIFEHILGFLLLGTALYLLSILPEAKYIPVLSALLVAALSAFLWEHVCSLEASKARRLVASVLFVGILAGSAFFALHMERTEARWTPFTVERFSAQLGERPMIVEFTADWCPNCKFVEATVFNERRLQQTGERYDAEFMRVDLTDPNAAGSKLLEMLGSRSIPLTAIFPAGDNATSPTVLRDVFSAQTFDNTVRAAFAR
ncbi:MAG: cytochrome c biogenesis protein CcdA [Desulfovibrionaceae bacterium]|nr:cytochrome c biogenesis protein CcdA [Desulfovibrionaceae bacterium]